MSVPVFAALLLFGAPMTAGGMPPAAISLPFVQAAAIEVPQTAPVEPPVATAQTVPDSAPAPDSAPGQAEAPATVQPVPSAAPQPDDGQTVVVTARPRVVPGDPLQQVNAESFAVTQKVDEAFVGPVAMTYKRTVPKPIRSGLRNFLNNLREPAVFLNFLLQLKPGKAIETVGRFSINSTIGIGGLVDVAKQEPFNLPRRPNGFANTLGYYGVKPGPFLFLPLIGPTTLRDLIGGGVDRLILPVAVGDPFTSPYYSVPVGVVSALDYRAEFDEELNKLRTDYPDPYAAARSYYLNRRQAEIDALHAMGHAAPRPGIPLVTPDLVPLKQRPQPVELAPEPAAPLPEPPVTAPDQPAPQP
ncbi:MlaA family lipoprotein [Sphingomonas sp. ZT3P38]|uniref:MlaA family lipoprotein n=1 Tax=Parasphingomonas zepuensis TaxID=3096161 RepID=UPI002FC6F97E